MVSDNYAGFLSGKRFALTGAGIEVPADRLHPKAHAFQRDLTRWALRKGRSAIFAQTGMGKTLMELMFSQEAARLGFAPLILAPLAVARQTVREGEKWGIPVTYARSQAQAGAITITNYEMVEHFNEDAFGAIVLDESSILKDYNSATRNRLIAKFAKTPMRLCCTATPAPNDIAEIANHAEFLGVMTRVEMLATFFTHDDDGWRLRKHAHEPFWRWLASWGMTLRKPSDLGYPNDGYDLPPLTIEPVIVPSDYTPEGQLFGELHGVGDRSKVRRATLDERVKAAVQLVDSKSTGSLCDKMAACGSQNTRQSAEQNTGPILRSGLGDVTSHVAPKQTATTCSPTTAPTKSDGRGIGKKTETIGTGDAASGTPPILNTESDVCNRHAPVAATRIDAETPGSEPNSESAPQNTMPSSNDKQGAAGFAAPSSEMRKADACTLTIATQVAGSAGSCVPSVISASASSEMSQSCSERSQNTYRRAEPWVIWCGLNDEQTALERAFGTRAVSVHGALSPDEKLARLDMWLNGERPILISKPAILGHGINMQHCARMVFVGLGDSFEQYFQSIRRCYRYGQTREVRVHIVLTDLEQAIHHNVLRKEAEAERMGAELVRHVARFERAEIGKLDDQQGAYQPTQAMRVPEWLRSVA